MRRRDDEQIAQELKYKIVQLNRTADPLQQIKGIMALIKLEVGYREARKVLYYAIERTLPADTKKSIASIIERAARSLNLTPTPLFT